MLFRRVFKLIKTTTRTMRAFFLTRDPDDPHWNTLSTEYRGKLITALQQTYDFTEDEANDIVEDAFARIVNDSDLIREWSDRPLRYVLALLCNRAVTKRYGDKRTREARNRVLRNYPVYIEGLLDGHSVHEQQIRLLADLRLETITKSRNPHFTLPGASRADIQRWVCLQTEDTTEEDIARRLGITQPAVSNSVKHVETALAKIGRGIFERNGLL